MTKDPEIKSLPNGTPVTSFGVATNSNYKDKEGTRHDKVEFHNIILFGRIAETCAQYLQQGQVVLVEGRITTRSWDKQDGTKAYKTEIIADNVQFGAKSGQKGTKDESEPVIDAESGSPRQTPAKPKTATATAKVDRGFEYPTEEINPEDIPF